MSESLHLPSTFDEFLADEWVKEANRLAGWKYREGLRSAGVGWSGMDTTPYTPATDAQIHAAALRRWEHHTMFAASPAAQFLSALSRLQNGAEASRACYARGFGDKAEVIAATDHLTDTTNALNDALDALKVIAEEHLA